MSNETLFAEALTHFPGGVSSPVRAFRAVGGTPKFFKKASGAWFEDEDGQRFLDLCMSWGPLILGHAHPDILAAVNEAMHEGLTFGAPSRRELALARRIKEMVPFIEKMRFVSSGTEAVMSALRAARGFTGRDRILKFDGCYHGHSDGLLVKAGSGLVTFGAPTSAGVPRAIAELTSVVSLDDLETLERTFAEIGNELAAAIIEPIPANNGLLLQRPEFLRRLRELCTKHGVVLIFDEVISGFRVAPAARPSAWASPRTWALTARSSAGACPWVSTAAARTSWASWLRMGPSTRRARSRAIPWPWPRDSPPWRS